MLELKELINAIQQELKKIETEKKLQESSLLVGENYGKSGNLTSYTAFISEQEYPADPYKTRVYDRNKIIFNIKPNDRSDSSVDFFVAGKSVTFQIGSDEVMDYVRKNALDALASYKSSSSFGCCSKFRECSEAGECLHTNKLYSTGCLYRPNMEAGNAYMLNA